MKNRKIKSIFKWSAFLIYIVALIYFVFFAEMLGRADVPVNYRYNLVPFKEIKRFIIYYRQIGINAVILNLAGNVVAFITAFSLSLSIELIQLISKVGSCDVDDLILNTLGGLLGYWCFCIYKNMNRAYKKSKEQGKR